MLGYYFVGKDSILKFKMMGVRQALDVWCERLGVHLFGIKHGMAGGITFSLDEKNSVVLEKCTKYHVIQG